MKESSEIYSTRSCSTADEFLEFLLPIHDEWADSRVPTENPWIYRGHWDSDWDLKPPAWRPKGQKVLATLGRHLERRAKELSVRHADYMDHKFGARQFAEEWTLQH